MYQKKVDVRQINISKILTAVINYGTTSRAKISEITKINKASVSEIVDLLIDEDLIQEVGVDESSNARGPKPILLAYNYNYSYGIVIDISKDYILAQCLKFNGEILEEIQLEKKICKNNIKTILTTTIDFLLDAQSYRKCSGISLAIHGITLDNKIFFTPNYDLDQINLYKYLKETYELPIFINNESNMSALGEYTFGTSEHSLISINIHSGIGAGVVSNGEVFSGENGYIGEIGHLILFPGGRTCPCGNNGCLERYISIDSIIKEAQKIIPTIENVADLVKYYDTDKNIHSLLNKSSEYLAIGINNIISLTDPKLIIINSEIHQSIPILLNLTENYLVNFFKKTITIKLSHLNNHPTLLGCITVIMRSTLNVSNVKINNSL